MKYLFSLLIVLFSNELVSQSLSSVSSKAYIIDDAPKKDSLHSSMVLSVEYHSDTLYIRARHYAVCCEKFVHYIDKKDDLSQINFVVKSLEKGCICEVEKILMHKIYAKNLQRDIKLKINGDTPKYGILKYTSVENAIGKKNKRKRNKEM